MNAYVTDGKKKKKKTPKILLMCNQRGKIVPFSIKYAIEQIKSLEGSEKICKKILYFWSEMFISLKPSAWIKIKPAFMWVLHIYATMGNY